jgi:hypothetical protein
MEAAEKETRYYRCQQSECGVSIVRTWLRTNWPSSNCPCQRQILTNQFFVKETDFRIKRKQWIFPVKSEEETNQEMLFFPRHAVPKPSHASKFISSLVLTLIVEEIWVSTSPRSRGQENGAILLCSTFHGSDCLRDPGAHIKKESWAQCMKELNCFLSF